MTTNDPEPVEIIPRNWPVVSYKELVLQLVIVTAGVLIALLLESLVEWNHYRNLVVEARQNIAREIADNKKEIESADRTGALAHMPYADVQEYARLYGFQELFAAQQRRAIERLALASSMFGTGAPDKAPATDVEAFRQHVLALGADLVMAEQLAQRLNEHYQRMLSR